MEVVDVDSIVAVLNRRRATRCRLPKDALRLKSQRRQMDLLMIRMEDQRTVRIELTGAVAALSCRRVELSRGRTLGEMRLEVQLLIRIPGVRLNRVELDPADLNEPSGGFGLHLRTCHLEIRNRGGEIRVQIERLVVLIGQVGAAERAGCLQRGAVARQ